VDPGGAHTVVVVLDRGAAREGPFLGGVHLQAGDVGSGTVGVAATIAARPPTITSLTTSEPDLYVQSAASCPDTQAVVGFGDESGVTGTLFWQAPSGSGQAELAVSGGQAVGTIGRPLTLETTEWWVVLVDDLGGTVESPRSAIAASFTCP
jgi:hypothetical protein